MQLMQRSGLVIGIVAICSGPAPIEDRLLESASAQTGKRLLGDGVDRPDALDGIHSDLAIVVARREQLPHTLDGLAMHRERVSNSQLVGRTSIEQRSDVGVPCAAHALVV